MPTKTRKNLLVNPAADCGDRATRNRAAGLNTFHYPRLLYSNPKTYYSSQARRMDKAARCLQTSARRALRLYYPQGPYSNPKNLLVNPAADRE